MRSKQDAKWSPIAIARSRSFQPRQSRSARELRHLEVILKVAERCNINCSYCYFFDSRNKDYLNKPPLISDETVEALTCFLEGAVADFQLSSIQIDFHGGEPLLLPKARFEKMCAILSRRLGPGVDLRLSLQTNGMLIDDEWLDIFEKYNVYVGVSLDGEKDTHDQFRLDHRGRGTYDRVRAGLSKLHDRFGKKFAILGVLSNEQTARRAFKHFVTDLGAGNIHFIPSDQTVDTVCDADRQAVGASLISILNAWLACDGSEVKVRFITNAIRLLLDKEHLVAANEAWKSYAAITVQSDGAIGPDDDLRNILPDSFRTGMNVRNSNLGSFLDHPTIKSIFDDISTVPADCTNCCWRQICRSGSIIGAPLHRFSRERGFSNPSVYCERIQGFLLKVCSAAIEGGHSIDAMARVLT